MQARNTLAHSLTALTDAMPPRKRAAAAAAADTVAPAPAATKRPASPDVLPSPKKPTPAAADDAVIGKVVVKGLAAVDASCPFASGYHVYADTGGPWDFTGNQTNIGANNNKFYIIQLLQSDTGSNYRVWTRWGRVGAPGQNAVLPSPQGSSLDACKAAFESKFKDKSGNHWANRANFVKHEGKYDLVRIDYSAEDADEIEEALAKPKPEKPKVVSASCL